MDLVNSEDLNDPDKAIDKSQWFLKERSHDAERYVERYLSVIDPEGSFSDSNINEFLSKRGLNCLDRSNPESRKTPDVIIKVGSVIIVGDVAVSRSPESTIIRKRMKYQMLMDSVKVANPSVFMRFESFVFRDDGTNIEDVLDKISNIVNEFNPLYKWRYGDNERRLKEQLLEWQSRLKYIARNVVDKTTYIYNYQRMLAEEDDEFLLGEYKRIDEYKPKFSEEEIAESVFNYIKKGGEGDIKVTKGINLVELKNEMDMERDEGFKRTSRKHCIPYLFNSGDNSSLMDLSLLDDYKIDLSSHGESMSTMFPIGNVINDMRKIKSEFEDCKINSGNKSRKEFKEHIKEKYRRTTPYHALANELIKYSDHDKNISNWYFEKVSSINEKEEPKSIHSIDYDDCCKEIAEIIKLLNMKSKSKSSNLVFDMPDRGDRLAREKKAQSDIKEEYEEMNSKIATCVLSCIRKFVNDIAYMPSILKKGIYYSIPVQKNMIILIFTNTNLTKRNPSIYFTSITRFKKSCEVDEKLFNMQSGVARHCCETTEYKYLLDKLHKYELEKLSKLANIDREFRIHYMSMMSMCDLEKEEKRKYLEKYTGLTTLCLLDLHQKPSDMLDLMKYLVAMPMSTHSSIDKLLKDKLSIMFKTNLDVYLYNNIFNFLEANIKLNNSRSLNKLLVQSNLYILPESFNITGRYAMFSDVSTITDNLLFYISESQLIFHARPKKLYSSQFIDKCAYKVVDYNTRMQKEEENSPGWTTEGVGRNDKEFNFPFENDFCFSRDAMYYSQLDEDAELAMFIPGIMKSSNSKVLELFPNNLSMRGACIIPDSSLDKTKDIERRMRSYDEVKKVTDKLCNSRKNKPLDDIFKIKRSTTAMLSGLTMMENEVLEDRTDECRVGYIMSKHKNDEMFFNMSEKEQRGGGRPIGSADFFTKQRLYCIEMIYQKIGERQPSNLMAKKVNRAAKLSDVSRNMITRAVKTGKSILSYVVMDQSQFSESDNINKFIANIEDNKCIPPNLKQDLITSISKMKSRTQFFPKIPSKVREEYSHYITETKGIRGIAGWVQGMLNISSTHIHLIAVKWITKIFNKYYSKFMDKEFDEVIAEHLINSDDSFAIICSKKPHMIMDFYKFLLVAKKMFCLKQNKKKSYLSTLIGEVIQKYVANGSTVNIWAKDAVSIFNSIRGLDMYKDISTSIGSLQTISRNGAPEGICCYIRAECRDKVLSLYNINKGKVNDIASLGIDIGKLPIELLGWPKYLTTYELCVSGAFAQSTYCLNEYEKSKDKSTNKWTSIESKIALAAVCLNIYKSMDKSSNIAIFDEDEEVDKADVVVDELKRVRMALEAEDDDDMFGNNDVETLQYEDKFRERSQIAFKSVGMDVIAGNFTKSLINPFVFCHPFPRKVTDTVKFLRKIDGEPSGLSGLLKLRTSIKTAVVDINENVNSLLMQLSESGFNNDFRMIAAASSVVASSRSVMISGSNKRHTVRQCMKILLDVAFKLENRQVMVMSQEKMVNILRDPTYRSVMADEILTNMNDSGYVKSKPSVVTLMPEMENDLGLVNPLQLVLADIIKPGTIASEGYTLNYPDQLSTDKNILISKFGDWLELSKDKLSVACGIYYHYLNARKGRYVVGPPMERSDMMAFLISWYKTKFANGFSITGSFSGGYRNKEVEYKDNSVNLVATVAEMYFRCCVISELIDKDVFLQNVYVTIKGARYSVGLLCNSEIIDVIMNDASAEDKPYIGAFVYHVTDNDKVLRRFAKSSSTRADWLQEQRKDYNPMAKRVTWTGEFIVDIVRGTNVVRIDGQPGNMNMIYSNTENTRVISELLLFLRRNNRFDNYDIKRDVKGLYNDRFYSTNDEIKISTIDQVIDPSQKYPIIRRNPVKEGKDVSYFTERGMVPIKIVDKSYFDIRASEEDSYIKFEFDYRRIPQLAGITKINTYEIDKRTGETVLVEKDNRTRLARLDNYFKNFTTNGITSEDIFISGLSMQELIEDEEIKNIIRSNIVGIANDKLRKYVGYLLPKSNVLSNLMTNIMTLHLDMTNKVDDLLMNLTEVDVDIAVEGISFDANIEDMDADDELEALNHVKLTDSEGTLSNKLLEMYSQKTGKNDDALDIVKIIASSNIRKAVEDVKNMVDPNDWNSENEIIDNMMYMFSFLMMSDIDTMRDALKKADDDIDDEIFSEADQESFVNNKEYDFLYNLSEDINKMFNIILCSRLYDIKVLKKAAKDYMDKPVSRSNKFISVAKFIRHNIIRTRTGI